MTLYSFPLPARSFKSVMKSLSPSYVHLFKTCFNERKTTMPKLLLDGVCFLDKKCNSRYIKRMLYYSVYTSPRCKFFWTNFFWQYSLEESMLLPENFCISNKIREVHFKILHNVYPTNSQIASFFYLSNLCVFCKDEEETLLHLCYYCNQVKSLWENLSCYLSSFIKCDLKFSLKHWIFLYFSGSDQLSIMLLIILFCIVHFLYIKPNFLIRYLDLMSFLQRFYLLLNLSNTSITIRTTSFLRRMMKFFLLIDCCCCCCFYVVFVFSPLLLCVNAVLFRVVFFLACNIYIYIKKKHHTASLVKKAKIIFP